MANSEFVRTKDAAGRCLTSVSTLEKLRVYGGGPPFFKMGRNVFYRINDLESWVGSKRRQSTSDFPSTK